MNRKRIWLRVLLVLGVMVVVALVVGGLWLARIGISAVGDLTSGAISLHAELDEARSEGVPLEPSDIRPSPPVPPHRNAAPFLREMGELYWAQSEPERNGTGVIIKAVGSPTRSNADRQEARDWLERRSRLIELAEKAGSMPDCDMEKPYEQGLAVEFREFAGAREAVRLLLIRAMLASDGSNYGAALRDIALGARIGRHVGKEPVIIALLVRVAIDAIVDRAFVIVVLDHMHRPEALRLARGTLAAFGSAPGIEHACRGEVVMARSTMRLIRSGQSLDDMTGANQPEPLRRVAPSPATRGLFCDATDARIVRYWRRAFARLRQHRGDYMAQGAALADIDRPIQAKADAKTPSYILLAILTPLFSQMADKVASEDAQRRMREGLVRIAEYRLRVGRFPKTLAEVGGTPLLDPFTGKSLQYRRTAKGFVLYSVGENRIDDGGKGQRPPNGGSAPDIVIEYPRRERP